MRVNRAKFIRKYLRFYKVVFRIEGIYAIILDGNFIYQALRNKIDIEERLARLLQDATLKPYIQRSVLNELKLVGESAMITLQWAQKYCDIIEDVILPGETPSDKLVLFLENKFQERKGLLNTNIRHESFFVATQDKDLRHRLSLIPGVPLIYLNKVTLVLEPPSDASKKYSLNIESNKHSLDLVEKDIIKALPHGDNVIGNSSESTSNIVQKVRIKRKPNAPNPLSNKQATKGSKALKKRRISKFKHN